MKKLILTIFCLAVSVNAAFAVGAAFSQLNPGAAPEIKVAAPPAPTFVERLAGADRVYQSEAYDAKDKADAMLQSYLLNLRGAGIEVVSSFVDTIEDGDSLQFRFMITYRGGELRNYVFDGFPAKDKADAARDQALAGFKKANFPVIKYGIRSAGGAFSFYAVYLVPEGDQRREMSYLSVIPEGNAALNIAAADTVKLLENNGMPVLYVMTSDAGTRFMVRFLGKGEVKRTQSGSHGSYVQAVQGAQKKLLELAKANPNSLPMDIEIHMSSLSYVIDVLAW